MVTVHSYYDFRSPFAYFAAHRIRNDLFAPAIPISWQWHAVSIDVLLNLQAGREPWAAYEDPLAPPKRRHFMKDVVRNAGYFGVPIKPPNPPRSNSIPALCAALAMERDNVDHRAFRGAVFAALWQHQRDIADRTILYECAEMSGVAKAFITSAYLPDARNALVAATRGAYDAGVFGVPTFVTGGEIFFGNDRLDILAWHLMRSGDA
jgi:2-hydroxychromene-2-carboxylate isomerase